MALNDQDKAMAAVSWAGLVAFGPILPAVLLATNWSRRNSLARRHALLAVTMHVVALVIWAPVAATQIIIPSVSGRMEPKVWVFVLGGTVGLTLIVLSTIGFVSALRAEVVPQQPPAPAYPTQL